MSNINKMASGVHPSQATVEELSKRFQDIESLSEVVEVNAGQFIRPHIDSHHKAFDSFYLKYTSRLVDIMRSLDLGPVYDLIAAMLEARAQKQRIYVMGNGGSASTAAHFVNDFSKHRFEDSRFNFRIMGLADNVAWITATANDEGYENIFINQLQNLMDNGDLVIAISSSGNSGNINKAISWAKVNGAKTFGIVGFTGGQLSQTADHVVQIPTKPGQYGFHEDLSLILNHIISVYIYEQDQQLIEKQSESGVPLR
jgi:D-sedoheptulose 7-phosphate isomerase